MNPDRIAAAYLLSLFRFVTGLTLFQFGVAKLFKFPPVPMFEAVTPFSLFGVAGMFELVLGGMLMLGLLTRPVAFVLSGEMACAYFIEHFPKNFFSAAQWRHARDRALLRLPVSGGGRRGSAQPRRQVAPAAVTATG